MKKCPKCKALIQEEARFCLFCMTSFEEKQTIEKSKKIDKRWIYIIAAALFVILIVAIPIIFLSKNNLPQQTDGSYISNSSDTSPEHNNDTSSEQQSSSRENDKNSSSKNNKPQNSSSNKNNGSSKPSNSSAPNNSSKPANDTSSKEENETSSKDDTTSEYESSTENESSSEDDTTSEDEIIDGESSEENESSSEDNTTSENPEEDESSSEDDTTSENPEEGESSSEDNTTSENPEEDESSSEDDTTSEDNSSETSSDTSSGLQASNQSKYYYTEATIENVYPTKYGATYAPENAVVITKVNYKEDSGNYVIPDTIDGKKVVAIMPSAFSDSLVSSSVKSVALPISVKTIWENAFKDCFNLTDLYIKSPVIEIYEDAFPDSPTRNGKLTIHCKRDCRNFDFYYYRNIAKRYNAEYVEWNG